MNNNKGIISQFAGAQYRADRKQHMILVWAIAFAVMTLFCVFSFAAGKIETDILHAERIQGIATSVTLEFATEEQYEQIKELSYIKDVGKYIQFGSIPRATCAVADGVTWEKIKKPAFTDICGTYPEEKTEIMLPMSALQAMGIMKPQVGMKLSVPIFFSYGSKDVKEYEFVLSGYYTEYINTWQYGAADAYFSQEFLDSVSGGESPDVMLYIRPNNRLEIEAVKKALYQDIRTMDVNQRNRFNRRGAAIIYNSSLQMAGFDTVLILAAVILVSVGLLIYNVLHISFHHNVREYGLLKTIGTTGKQLRRIVLMQMGKNVLYGGLIGAAVGLIVTLVVIPGLLSRMYLYGFGSAAGMITVHPLFLAGAFLFVSAVTFFCSMLAVRHTLRLTPVEAVSYMEKTGNVNCGERKSRRRINYAKKHTVSLSHMAWRNIVRFKKRFIISATCLSLGLIVSLSIVMISKGTDTVNKIDYDYPDIEIETQLINVMDYQLYKSHILFPDELADKLRTLPGVESSTVEQGGFGEVLQEEKAFDLVRKDEDISDYIYRKLCIIHIMTDEYLSRLESFAKENRLYLDVDSVISGEGVIFLHPHQLSPAQVEMSKDTVGMTLGIYGEGNKRTDMRFCGYLDLEQENLPKINTTWIDSLGGDVYLLISEKGFRKLQITKQNFSMDIQAKSNKRAALGREAEKLVKEYNSQYMPDENGNPDYRALNIYLKTDIQQKKRDYIVSNRLVLGALCVILLLMGIVNYMNVEITGLVVRKREFAVMESIGLTGRQLRIMLILEGVFYSMIITVLIGILGSGVLFVIGKVMHARMGYFTIQYPVVEFAVCVGVLFLSCISIVLVLYRRCRWDSISVRLRMYAD